MKKSYNENYIKEAAYYNWQNAGCPSGKDEYFWNMAIKQLYGTKSCSCSSTKTSSCKSGSAKTTTAQKTATATKTTMTTKTATAKTTSKK